MTNKNFPVTCYQNPKGGFLTLEAQKTLIMTINVEKIKMTKIIKKC